MQRLYRFAAKSHICLVQAKNLLPNLYENEIKKNFLCSERRTVTMADGNKEIMQDLEKTMDQVEKEKGGRVHAGRLAQVKIYYGKLLRMFVFDKQWKMIVFSTIISALVAKVSGYRMFLNMEYTKTGALAIACVCLWNGIFNSVQVVCRERPIIKREHRTGMHISAYLSAHILYQAILCLVQSTIMLLVFHLFGMKYPDQGLILKSFPLELLITLFLITLAADMLGLAISCIVHDSTTAMTVMPLVLIFQLVFAGVAFPLGNLSAKISNATISKWGVYAVCTEANYNSLPSDTATLLLNKMRADNEVLDQALDAIPIDDIRYYMAKYMADKNYDYNKNNLYKEWGILLAYAVGFALVALIALEFVDKDKR